MVPQICLYELFSILLVMVCKTNNNSDELIYLIEDFTNWQLDRKDIYILKSSFNRFKLSFFNQLNNAYKYDLLLRPTIVRKRIPFVLPKPWTQHLDMKRWHRTTPVWCLLYTSSWNFTSTTFTCNTWVWRNTTSKKTKAKLN